MALAALLASVLAGALGPAADEPAFELEWTAPKACPPRAKLVDAVEHLLGDLEPGEERVGVVGSITRADAGFSLALEIRTGDGVGNRSLTGASCEEVVEAAALIIAIAINPEVLEREPSAPANEEEAETPTSTEPPPPPPEDPPPSEDRGPWLHVRASGGLGAFILPGPTGVVALAIGTAGRGWRVEAEANYWFARERARDDGVSGRFSLGYVGVRGCGVPGAGPVEFPFCAGLDVGAMRGVGAGEGLQNARVQNGAWLALRGGPGLLWRAADWVGLLLQIDGIVPVVRPRFDTQPSGREVFRAGPAGLQLLAGVEFRPI